MDLGFEEKPNYEFYRTLFRGLYRKEQFEKEGPWFDWEKEEKVTLIE